MSASLNKDFDILIIGAGLIGSSTAMHLASFGAKSIAVIDADLAGRLSSSELNAGGARATWDQSINVQLARESIQYLKKHQDTVGFRECGYLWIHDRTQWEAAQRRNKFLAEKHGIQVQALSVPELQSRLPFVDKTEDLAGASFSPLDGLFNPNLLKNMLRDQARAKGVQFLEGHRVKKVELKGSEEVRVTCELVPPKNESELKEFLEERPDAPGKSSEHVVLKGKILVNCAGPWASRLADLIGYQTPVYAIRRQVSIFDCRDFDMSKYGMIVDSSGVYFHPEATNILGGYADHSEAKGFNLNYDGQNFFEEKIWMPLYNRSSKFEQLKHITGWGGLYEMTPDKTAILGLVPGYKNIYENHGYSGRGAMQSYAAGRGLAELMHFGKFQTLDLSPMTGARFTSGALLTEGLHI